MKKLYPLIAIIILAISISSVYDTAKEQNHKLKFQGKLKDSKATPLKGTYTVKFKLYDVDSGGEPLWEEAHSGIGIERGSLRVELGSMERLDFVPGKNYWLGVTVESDEEMSPRFKLTNK